MTRVTGMANPTAQQNGVFRVGRKGRRKFAFGEGAPFEVDVVDAYERWIEIDESFRVQEGSEGVKPEDIGTIPTAVLAQHRQAAVMFTQELSGETDLSKTEALEFIRMLREQYREMAESFRDRRHEDAASQDSSEVEHLFSVEEP